MTGLAASDRDRKSFANFRPPTILALGSFIFSPYSRYSYRRRLFPCRARLCSTGPAARHRSHDREPRTACQRIDLKFADSRRVAVPQRDTQEPRSSLPSVLDMSRMSQVLAGFAPTFGPGFGQRAVETARTYRPRITSRRARWLTFRPGNEGLGAHCPFWAPSHDTKSTVSGSTSRQSTQISCAIRTSRMRCRLPPI